MCEQFVFSELFWAIYQILVALYLIELLAVLDKCIEERGVVAVVWVTRRVAPAA